MPENINDYPLREIVDIVRLNGFRGDLSLNEEEAQHLVRALLDGPLSDSRVLGALMDRFSANQPVRLIKEGRIMALSIIPLDENGERSGGHPIYVDFTDPANPVVAPPPPSDE